MTLISSVDPSLINLAHIQKEIHLALKHLGADFLPENQNYNAMIPKLVELVLWVK